MIKNSRQIPHLVRWSQSLRELLYQGKPEEVIEQYRHRPTSWADLSAQTYCILFKACISTKNWSEGHQVHAQIKSNAKLYRDQRLKIARIQTSFFLLLFIPLFFY